MTKRIAAAFTAFTTFILFALPAYAADEAASGNGMVAIGAALAIGLAALGGSLGQGRAAAAALEGIARNPQASGKLFVPMILGLALIESLVIYALVVALSLAGKV